MHLKFIQGFCKNAVFLKKFSSEVFAKQELTMLDIPRPKSLPIFGTKLDFWIAGRGSRLHDYIDKRHQSLGNIFCERLGSAEIVFISDPTLMKTLFLNLEGKYPRHILPEPWVLYEKLYGPKRGLFFMDGEDWLTYRRPLNRHLLKDISDKGIEVSVKETITAFVENWKLKIKSGKTLQNIESDLYKLSIEVIISLLFGNKVIKTRHSDELLAMFAENVKKVFSTTTKLSGLPLNLCHQLNLKPWKDFMESVDISLFLAHKLVKEMITKKCFAEGLISKLIDDGISEDIIVRIVADFVIAAGDTTSYTTLWTLFLLATNQEMLSYSRQNDENIKSVLKESMRLYPVAPFLTRILHKESFLGGYNLPENTPVVASIYTSGRDEHNFSQATQFLPYRWDRDHDRKSALPNHVPSASMPFAIGVRSCIGRKIAMLQLQEIVKQVVNSFEIKCLKDSLDIQPVTSQVLVPNKEINFQFILRK